MARGVDQRVPVSCYFDAFTGGLAGGLGEATGAGAAAAAAAMPVPVSAIAALAPTPPPACANRFVRGRGREWRGTEEATIVVKKEISETRTSSEVVILYCTVNSAHDAGERGDFFFLLFFSFFFSHLRDGRSLGPHRDATGEQSAQDRPRVQFTGHLSAGEAGLGTLRVQV